MSDEQPSENQAFGRERQGEIYFGGIAGDKPKVPVDMDALESAAKRNMTAEAFAYIAGGAGTESTMNANRQAFEKWRIVPRMLTDTSQFDTSTTILDQYLPSPFMLAPIGVLDMAHPDADLAVARATRDEKIPMIYSNQASHSMEATSEIMGDVPHWFQLYWSELDDVVISFLERAEKSDCSAIVVTLDTTVLGWRIRDLDLAYLPFLRGRGIAQYTSDPVFMANLQKEASDRERKIRPETLKTLWQMINNHPGAPLDNLRSGEALAAVQTFINTFQRTSLKWDDLAFLREHTSLPIILKGILHPLDARKAIEYGMDGIIVSNHGGRQVDGSISTFDALQLIKAEVGDEITILMDSGIRSGADIFKAIAMGADSVLLGRPYVYGLAAGGYEGVREVLRNYRADFELTMRLSGCHSLDEITSDCLVKIE